MIEGVVMNEPTKIAELLGAYVPTTIGAEGCPSAIGPVRLHPNVM
jgi:hypothetical protein